MHCSFVKSLSKTNRNIVIFISRGSDEPDQCQLGGIAVTIACVTVFLMQCASCCACGITCRFGGGRDDTNRGLALVGICTATVCVGFSIGGIVSYVQGEDICKESTSGKCLIAWSVINLFLGICGCGGNILYMEGGNDYLSVSGF